MRNLVSIPYTAAEFGLTCVIIVVLSLSGSFGFTVDNPFHKWKQPISNGAITATMGARIKSQRPLFLSTSQPISSKGDENEGSAVPEIDQLIDMDVVVYSFVDDEEETKRFAALQEDGVLSPISAWTDEPAFGDSIEFLVDEEDRFRLVDKMDQIRLHYLIDEQNLSYGSRQCHRGVSNPHGEESELLYYIEKGLIEKFDAQVDIKPDLEILW